MLSPSPHKKSAAIDIVKPAGVLATLGGAGAALGAVLCMCARAFVGKNRYTQFDDWMGTGTAYGVVLGLTILLSGKVHF